MTDYGDNTDEKENEEIPEVEIDEEDDEEEDDDKKKEECTGWFCPEWSANRRRSHRSQSQRIIQQRWAAFLEKNPEEAEERGCPQLRRSDLSTPIKYVD